ncbi:MAG: DUF1326 domain-containing protein [Deinococcales bacterium]|jgi:hypothetical protein
MSWNLNGIYFESCNCDAACPCVFLSDPTHGDCTVLVGWHIEDGRFENVNLSGLNVAMAAYAPGNMAKEKWQAALYVDDRATEEQAKGLATIFSGQAGGVPAALHNHIGTVLGAGPASIDVTIDGRRRAMTIGDVGSLALTTAEGQGGGPIHISGHPLAVAPGNPAQVGTSDHLRYTDHGFDVELSGSTAFTSPFQYQG